MAETDARAEIGGLPKPNACGAIIFRLESGIPQIKYYCRQGRGGALETTIYLVNGALGSLKIVFLGLEPPQKFKDFLETWAKNKSEPESYITALFGVSSIP